MMISVVLELRIRAEGARSGSPSPPGGAREKLETRARERPCGSSFLAHTTRPIATRRRGLDRSPPPHLHHQHPKKKLQEARKHRAEEAQSLIADRYGALRANARKVRGFFATRVVSVGVGWACVDPRALWLGTVPILPSSPRSGGSRGPKFVTRRTK